MLLTNGYSLRFSSLRNKKTAFSFKGRKEAMKEEREEGTKEAVTEGRKEEIHELERGVGR